MLTAFNFRKVRRAVRDAEQTVNTEMPQARFIFVGADNDYIYFNVVARYPSDGEIRDIKEKTGFEIISEADGILYKVECRMAL